jgi:acetyltransferase-like isoleucine patch superfamily enzyme
MGLDVTSVRKVQEERRTALTRAVTAGRICRGHARLRLGGASQVGKNPVLIGKATLQLRGKTRIGDYFMIEGTVGVLIKVAPGASLTIGDRVYMNGGTSIEAHHEVIIGNNVLMAPFASIVDDDRHQVEPDSVRYKGPTIVGSNVWLGRNVVILPGVTIGDGAVIGANSVVTKSVPPNSFAAGSPAQVLRKLDIPEEWQRVLPAAFTPLRSVLDGRRPAGGGTAAFALNWPLARTSGMFSR